MTKQKTTKTTFYDGDFFCCQVHRDEHYLSWKVRARELQIVLLMLIICSNIGECRLKLDIYLQKLACGYILFNFEIVVWLITPHVFGIKLNKLNKFRCKWYFDMILFLWYIYFLNSIVCGLVTSFIHWLWQQY